MYYVQNNSTGEYVIEIHSISIGVRIEFQQFQRTGNNTTKLNKCYLINWHCKDFDEHVGNLPFPDARKRFNDFREAHWSY